MKCAHCGSNNSATARFCTQCGAELGLRCPQCGTELPPQARFCLQCGQPLTQPTGQISGQASSTITPLTGERRQATIMMADVQGSTDMAERIDVETWVEIMNNVFQILGQAIYRYGGEIDQYRGDGLVAFFGTKAAHEDDPERAVLAALTMQEAVHDYARHLAETQGIDLLLRAGINTGEVIAATVGSQSQHAEDTAMGRAIALAARLETTAEPGTVQVSENTYRLVASQFEWQPLGRIQLKGFSQAQPVYRPLAYKPGATKMRGIAGLESPLVGRQAAIDALYQAIERVQAGIGGIVTVVGEAGLGKSRLVTEVRDSAPIDLPSGLWWNEGRCLSYASSTAYQLWLDMHRSVLDVGPGVSRSEVSDALRMWVGLLCPDSQDQVLPFLTQVLSLPLDAKSQDFLHGLGADGLKMGTFRAIEALVIGAAQKRPVVIVCEDLHWADNTSLELLERILGVTDRVPLLLICVLRPDVDHGCWQIREIAAREYRHRHTDIWLSPLSDEQSKTLVENLLRIEAPPLSLQQAIFDTAEGNPFYVEEILRSLMQEGVIAPDESSGRWTVTRSVQEIRLPSTLHGVLIARIDRLDAECKRVLQLASVIGRIFDPRVLDAIVEENTRPNLQQHLVTLQRTQMIRQRTWVSEPAYIFKHQLTHEAAYGGLLNRERRRYHRRVAEVLERLYADRIPEIVEVLAHHWEQGEEFEHVVHYLILAGDRARQMGASSEALSFLSSAQTKVNALSPVQRASDLRLIHEYMGDIYMENLSRYDEALEHYGAFLDLCRSDEDCARGARKVGSVHLLRGNLAEAQASFDDALDRLSALPPLIETSRAQFCLAYLCISRGQWTQAAQHAETSLEISTQLNDQRGTADAYRAIGIVADARGDVHASMECKERSLALYRELGDLMRIAQACNNLGETYRLQGRMEAALELFREGLQITRRIGDARDEALLLITSAELHLDRGCWESAIEQLQRAQALAQESGTVSRLIEGHWLLGVAYGRAEQPSRARHHLETAEVQSRDTQHLRYLPRIYLDLARLDAMEGRFDEALQYIERAEEAAGPAPTDRFQGLAHTCRGCVLGQRGDWDAAVEHLTKGLTVLERANLPVQVARAQQSLGTAFARRDGEGDRGRAREHLLGALSTFCRIEARKYAATVKAELEQLDNASGKEVSDEQR